MQSKKSLVTSQKSAHRSHDPQEPATSLSQSRATRASNPQFRIREVCMFCGYKNNGDKRLMSKQDQSVAGKLKKQCKVNDTEI